MFKTIYWLQPYTLEPKSKPECKFLEAICGNLNIILPSNFLQVVRKQKILVISRIAEECVKVQSNKRYDKSNE